LVLLLLFLYINFIKEAAGVTFSFIEINLCERTRWLLLNKAKILKITMCISQAFLVIDLFIDKSLPWFGSNNIVNPFLLWNEIIVHYILQFLPGGFVILRLPGF